MKKKKIITCLALLGLGLTGLFASPIVSHAEEAPAAPTAINLSQTRETTIDKPYKMVNEKGVETTIINSGHIYDVLDGQGNFNANTLDPNSSEYILNKTNGNVFIAYNTLSDIELYDVIKLSPYGFSFDPDFMYNLANQNWDFAYNDAGGTTTSMSLYYFKRGSKLSEFLDYAAMIINDQPEFDFFFTDYVVSEITSTPGGEGTINCPYTLNGCQSGNNTITNADIININFEDSATNGGYETFADLVDFNNGDYQAVCENLTASDIEGKVILFNNGFFQSTGYLDSLAGPIDCNINVEPFGSKGGKEFFNITEYGFSAYGVLNATNFLAALEQAALDFSNGDKEVDFVLTKCTFSMIDTTAPEIGGTVHLSVNVDSQPTLDEIISHVYAKDETDGWVPIKVESSTYVQGVMEVGDYDINVSASDTNLNKSTAIIEVHRYDNTGPVINGTDSYDLNYDHDLTLEKIESALTITDNVDTGLVLEKVSDTFTGNEHKLGNYQIVYRAKDKSNIYGANKTIDLSVKNKGTAVITVPKEITVTISQPLTLAQLKERISVVDGYDGTITNYQIDGFDDYEAKSGVVGSNTITISYTNSGNNTATASTTIKKQDDRAPGIYFDSGFYVILPQGQDFTLEQFKQHVAKVLMISPEEIESVEGEYDVNTAGEYTMKVKLASGTIETFNIAVGDVQSSVKPFQFKDLFTGSYWKTTYNNFLANMTKPGNWNWMNWTLVSIAGLILAAVVGILFYRKKKQG